MSNEFSPGAISKRVRLLRKAKGFKHGITMAKMIGVSQSRYSNWENGIGVPPVEFALEICKLTGATLDYIYTGNRSSLPMHLVEFISNPPPDTDGKSEA